MHRSINMTKVLKTIWISVGLIVAAYMSCVFAYFFIAGSILAGQTLKGFIIWIFTIVISLPQILYAIVIVLVWIIAIAIAQPLDTVFTVLGGVVLVAIFLGYSGYFEDAEPVIRRGSSLQSASSVRRRLGGQRESPSNRRKQSGTPVQTRRGSRLGTAESIRNRFASPTSWRKKLWSLLNPGRWFSRRNTSKSPSTRLARPSSPASLRGRRGRLD